jgi:hypothetical protein
MTIAVNSTILAGDYNAIQTTVSNILGTGSGDRGYGQVLSSNQVAAGNSITASQMQNLRTDLSKISFHQTNVQTTAPVVNVGGTILANDWLTYSTQATNLDTNRFNIAAEQATLTIGTTSTLASGMWNDNRRHQVSVTFSSADNARYFFNAGGEIRITASITGYTSPTTKGGRWHNLFNTAQTIRFRAHSTLASGGQPSPSVGWYTLTTGNETQIFTIIDSGTYSGNDWTINATKSSSTVLTLNIHYRDDGSIGLYDEDVDGTLTSTVQHFRATGSYVVVSAPTVQTTVHL